jgi:putative transposase
MNEDSSVVRLRQPGEIDDPLTALLRSGARRLLEQAIEAEVKAFLASTKELKLPDGRDRLVRHGHGPERTIQTGIGPVEVQRAKVRDRAPGHAAERILFTSALLPRWARRTTSLDALLPILYLRGISTDDFQKALGALLGKDAPNLSNLSPAVVAQLKEGWAADYARWQGHPLLLEPPLTPSSATPPRRCCCPTSLLDLEDAPLRSRYFLFSPPVHCASRDKPKKTLHQAYEMC